VSPNDIAGTSLDHVHFMYGPGGTDEVWFAPADEVFQYLATQNFATVHRIDSRSVVEGYKPARIRQVAFRQGWNGYTGVTDTSIDAGQPKINLNGQTDMWVRTPDISAALLRFDLSSIPTDAYVLRATLGVYVVNHSNQGDIAVEAYTLRKAWNVNEVTWERASASVAWTLRGANGTSGDDKDRDSVYTDRRSFRWYRYVDPFTKQETMLDDASWYSLDVTQAAREWVTNPSMNFGVVLKGSGGSVGVKLKTSENRDVHLRPCLVITYMEPEVPPAAVQSPIPEPTATMTPTPTATATLKAEPTYTATPSPTATAAVTVSPSPTAMATPHPPFQLALPVVFVNLPYPAPH
jgi:hypothetical protein